jgi:DNA-directed RNA polymerase subunit P
MRTRDLPKTARKTEIPAFHALSEVSVEKPQVPAPSQAAQPEKVFTGAVYECVRCGTRTTQEELMKLPEVKCICGYRVFRKARPQVVKQVKAV